MAYSSLSAALPAMADHRDGIVTRKEILRADFRPDDIKKAVTRRLLVPALPGIYLVARQTLTPRALLHVALARAEPAMLDGMCAAEHRGWFDPRTATAQVATLRPKILPEIRTLLPMSGGRPGLIIVRSTETLNAQVVDGMWTACVPRTLVSVAASHGSYGLARAWKQADYHGVLDLDAVGRYLERARHPGASAVRELYLKHPGLRAGPATFNSPSEVDFRQLVSDVGLPDPRVNVPVRTNGNRYVLDFFWEEFGLVAEVDDPSHDRPMAREADRARDADLGALGLCVERFDTRDLTKDPGLEMRRLAAAMRRLQPG